jgi:hypothetical protein
MQTLLPNFVIIYHLKFWLNLIIFLNEDY